jgi:hypothetical protein
VHVLGGHEDDAPAGSHEPVEPSAVLGELTRLGVPPTVVLERDLLVRPAEVHVRHEASAIVDDTVLRHRSGQVAAVQEQPHARLLG